MSIAPPQNSGQISHRDMMPDVSLVYNTHPGHSGSAFAHFLLSSDDVKSYDIILEPPNPCQHTLVCGVLCGDLCLGPLKINIIYVPASLSQPLAGFQNTSR